MAYLNKGEYVLICGNGYIGSNLSKYFQQKNLNIIVITRFKKKSNANIKYLKINLSNTNEIFRKLKNYRIKFIINAFGAIDHSGFFTEEEDKIFFEHFIVTKNLAKLGMRKKISKFIQIGSADEYGSINGNFHEDVFEKPSSPYGFYKFLSTKYLVTLQNEKLLNSVVLRLFTTYGPNQSINRFIPFVINQSKLNKEFNLTNCLQYRDFIHIDDLVVIIYKVMIKKKSLKNIILNVGTSKKIQLKKIVKFIVKYIGKGKPNFGKIKYSSPNYNKILIADNKKLITYIGKFQFKELFSEIYKIID